MKLEGSLWYQILGLGTKNFQGKEIMLVLFLSVISEFFNRFVLFEFLRELETHIRQHYS